MKRSGVKELVSALTSNGISIDDIVIERDQDGAVRVYKKDKALTAKLSPLEVWKQKQGENHAQAS